MKSPPLSAKIRSAPGPPSMRSMPEPPCSRSSPGPPTQRVVVLVAVERVPAGAALDHVGAEAAAGDVVAVAAAQDVDARAPLSVSLPCPARQAVRPGVAGQQVIAAAPVYAVRPLGAAQEVSARAAAHEAGTEAAGARCSPRPGLRGHSTSTPSTTISAPRRRGDRSQSKRKNVPTGSSLSASIFGTAAASVLANVSPLAPMSRMSSSTGVDSALTPLA